MSDELERIVITPERADEEVNASWENDLREAEKQVELLERDIDRKSDELKEMKKELKDRIGRLRRLVAMGSKEYLDAHPLFEGIVN